MVVAWTVDHEQEDERESTIVARKMKLWRFYFTYIAIVDNADCLYMVGIDGIDACWMFRSW